MQAGVFFDFDGTLADTAPDLAAATNQLLIDEGRAPLPFARLRPFVSGGSPALIKIAFGIAPKGAEFERLKEKFLAFYADGSTQQTGFFTGIKPALSLLERHHIPWGIITNKPDYLTHPILAYLELAQRAAVVICGDTYPVKKPDPWPLLEACRISGCEPKVSYYVGDDLRDMQAAKGANMRAVCAEWGYLGEQDPQAWPVDDYLATSTELAGYLAGQFNLNFHES